MNGWFAYVWWSAWFLVAAAVASVATEWLIGWTSARGVLDRPNDRSSHTRVTPRGGGIAIVAVMAWAVLLAAMLWPNSRVSLVALLGAWASGLRVLGLGDYAATLALLGFNLWFYFGRRGGERAADLAAATGLFTALVTASAVLTYVAFRAGMPLADERFAAWDAALGAART